VTVWIAEFAYPWLLGRWQPCGGLEAFFQLQSAPGALQQHSVVPAYPRSPDRAPATVLSFVILICETQFHKVSDIVFNV
jgi:hypothetical protein